METLPTRLGLSMRTADITTPSGGPVIVATSSAHLGPRNMSEKHRANSSDLPGTTKTQTGNSSNAPLGPFLEMYSHLMRAMEDEGNAGIGSGATEEPQDLSLHQLPSGERQFCQIYLLFCITFICPNRLFSLLPETTKMDGDYSDYSDSDYEASRSSLAKMTSENSNLGPLESKENPQEGSGSENKSGCGNQKPEVDLQESGMYQIV